MRLCDTRFAGMAKGIGSARILGRVHAVKVQVGAVVFLASFTILDMEGGTDFLLGLDQLRKHRSCIDLEKNCLRILGQDIPFLAEKDLPASARGQEQKEGGGGSASSASGAQSSAPHAASPSPTSSSQVTRAVAGSLPPPQSRPTPVATLQPTTLPSHSSSSINISPSPGQSITITYPPGTTRPAVNVSTPMSISPSPRPPAVVSSSPTPPPPSSSTSGLSEQKVSTLMELGFQRPEAERALRLHNGNEEQAASFLFQQQYGA